jgi:hypothetical protein
VQAATLEAEIRAQCRESLARTVRVPWRAAANVAREDVGVVLKTEARRQRSFSCPQA